MRAGRAFESGRGQMPSVFLPNSVFRRRLAADAPLASTSAKFSAALARQLNYGNPNFNFNNLGGYEGMGSATWKAGYSTTINWKQFTHPVYIAPPGQPEVPVTLVVEEAPVAGVNAAEETPRSGEFFEALQLLFNSVPMPDPAKVLFGRLPSVGTDGTFVLYQPSTGRMWEMHRLSQFKTGPKAGQWKCGFGGFHNAKTWNAIGKLGPGPEFGATSASGLAVVEGLITFQDLIEVLRGGSINHALSLAVIARRNEHLAPAISHDFGPNNHPTYVNAGGETVPNPAYETKGYESAAAEAGGVGNLKKGYADAVPEGSWYRLPESAVFEEFALPGGKLEKAIFEAIRKYGLVVRDASGTCAMYLENYQALGSPYSWSKVNPLAGSPFTEVDEIVNNIVPVSWTDSTLPKLTETAAGPESALYKLYEKCASSLVQIEPFSS
jgi:hypothetical protein